MPHPILQQQENSGRLELAVKWVSECMSQPKILTPWNEASASDKATDKLLRHLGALSETACAGQKPSAEPARGSKGPFALDSAKDALKMAKMPSGLHWLQPFLQGSLCFMTFR